MGLTTQVAVINSQPKALLVGTDASGNLAAAHVMVNSSGVEVGTSGAPITVNAIVTAFTTQGAGTTSDSAGTFTAAITAPGAGTIRKGGALWNTGEQQLLIYFGSHTNATAAAAIPLMPGDSISCTLSSGVVLQDEVAVACSVAASQSFVVTVQ